MQNQYVIESNIPVASRMNRTRKYRARKHNWPVNSLNVGDSFFVPITEFSKRVQRGEDYVTHSANSVLGNIKKITGIKYKFTTRQEGQGVRIWRVQ